MITIGDVLFYNAGERQYLGIFEGLCEDRYRERMVFRVRYLIVNEIDPYHNNVDYDTMDEIERFWKIR